MLRKISADCDLLLNAWFADDGIIVGEQSEICKSLEILASEGLSVQYSMKPEKSTVYWPVKNVGRREF